MAALENDPQTATRCLRDIVALSTLPAIWSGAAPLRIAESLAASLFTMLEPEFVFVYVVSEDGKPPIAIAQTDRHETSPSLAAEFTDIILDQARTGDPDELLSLPAPGGKGVLRVVVRPLGADAVLGVIAAAFHDSNDLTPSHGLVLNVGASQAVTAILNARLLRSLQVSEERSRIVNEELSRHVADLGESRRTALSLMEDAMQAQRTLTQRTAQYETLLNRAPLGVYLVDADFRLREVNPMALPAFGSIPEPIGRDFGEILRILWPGKVAEGIIGTFRHTLETGESHVTPEHIEQRLDRGVKEYYEWRIDRIPLPDGRYGVVCYFRDVSAQVLAREEIARSAERFRAFVTATSDVIYRMSPDWSEMHHLEGQDFIADTRDPSPRWLEKYFHPDDKPFVLSAIHEAIASKRTFELEHRVIRLDGTLGWTFSRAIPLLDTQGNLTEWFGTARDVTQRKLAEEALARMTAHSEQLRRLYHAILATTLDLVYVFDLDHRFTYANEALLAMWGKTAEQAIGKTCLELGYEPWHAALHDREIEQVVATKQPVRGDVPFTGTQGRRIYDYIFVPVLSENGEVEAVAGTTRDVTDRRLAEERIRESEERLRFMAESMPQKIFTAKPTGDVDYFNRQWMEFTGLSFEQIRDWGWTQMVHPDDVEENVRVWRQSIQTGEPFQFTHRLRRADGVYRWHLARAHAMRAPDGGIAMWIGSNTDIHDQKDTETDLRRANEDLNQFAFAASHDLQEPLRMITSYSQLLIKDSREGHLASDAGLYTGYIMEGTKRIRELLADLLSYTAAGADGHLAPENVHLNDVFEVVVTQNLHASITESEAVVTRDELPVLCGHRAHFIQLLQNLIGNALKYRAEHTPRIHVASVRRHDEWRVAVSDNCIGIAPEYHERIFGVFKRLHGRNIPGTGIGLAICQRVVERYGGRIWVESEPDRPGATFYFTLPILENTSKDEQ